LARITQSSLIVMGGLLASMVFGLVRQRVIAARFGTGAELDAFTAANGPPELLFTMLAGGALAFAYIPLYSKSLSNPDRGPANKLVSQVINAIFLLTGIAAILVSLFANQLIRAPWGLAPNFSPEQQILTAQLIRILLLSTLIFVVSSIITGTLHAHQHFLLPAITPIMYSLGIISGALFLAPKIGVFGLAWGAVLGAALHLAIQIPGLIHFKVRWRPVLDLKDPNLQRVAVLMAPRVIDLLMARASIDWINANLGSGLGVGRVSALRYAYQLMNMPWTLVGTAIGIAIFPTMATLAAKKDLAAQRSALSGSLRAILTLTLPAAIGLIFLGRPIIQLLFEGGEFTSQSTELVLYALRFYSVAIISQSMLEVVVRAFAAQQDTRTPLFVSFFTTALNLGLALLLAKPISQGGLEHGGLALANGVAVAVEASIGLTILHFRWKGVNLRRILTDFGKSLLAAVLMAITILTVQRLLQAQGLISLLAGGGAGILSYLVVAYLLGLKEIWTVPKTALQHILGKSDGSSLEATKEKNG
jgi:putative peptidoglycan lipid II flippase